MLDGSKKTLDSLGKIAESCIDHGTITKMGETELKYKAKYT